MNADVPAGTYTFGVNEGKAAPLNVFTGTLTVLTLDEAKEKGLITYDGFDLYKYTTVDGTETAIAGATFEVYKHTPGPTETPVASFATGTDGTTKIDTSKITKTDDYPNRWGNYYYLVDASGAGEVNGGQYKAIQGFETIQSSAALQSDDSGKTIGLKLSFSVNGADSDSDSPFQRYDDNGARKLKVYAEPAQWAYKGFDLVAWTADALTWNRAENRYEFTEAYLAGAKFGVFADADCKTLIKAFTTGDDGKVKVTAEDFAKAYIPTTSEPKTYYLKQTGAQGERPMAEEVWPLTATTAADDAGDMTVTLSLPVGDEGLSGQQETENGKNEFWVYNQRYCSLSFDIAKEVVVKNKGEDPGENTFEFLVAVDMKPGTTADSVKLSFTPEGGEKTYVERYKKTTHEQGNTVTYITRYFTVSLPVDGEGRVKGTVTLEGWESNMYIGVDVYEMGDAPADWEYASYMYRLDLPVDGDDTPLLYDGVQMDISCYEASADGWKGYDERSYAENGFAVQSVTFVNTYTKAAPAAATPAPTATPAPAKAVKTGDAANLALWLALAMVSALGLGYVSVRKKEN